MHASESFGNRGTVLETLRNYKEKVLQKKKNANFSSKNETVKFVSFGGKGSYAFWFNFYSYTLLDLKVWEEKFSMKKSKSTNSSFSKLVLEGKSYRLFFAFVLLGKLVTEEPTQQMEMENETESKAEGATGEGEGGQWLLCPWTTIQGKLISVTATAALLYSRGRLQLLCTVLQLSERLALGLVKILKFQWILLKNICCNSCWTSFSFFMTQKKTCIWSWCNTTRVYPLFTYCNNETAMTTKSFWDNSLSLGSFPQPQSLCSERETYKLTQL